MVARLRPWMGAVSLVLAKLLLHNSSFYIKSTKMAGVGKAPRSICVCGRLLCHV